MRPRVSYDSIGALMAVCDTFIILACSIAAGAIYQYFIIEDVSNISSQLGIGVVASVSYALIAWLMGLYDTRTLLKARRDYGQMLLAWLLVISLIVLLLFLFKLSAQISRGSVICFVVSAIVLLVSWRKTAKRILRFAFEIGAVTGPKVVLVGTRNELASLRPDALLESFGLREVDRVVLPFHDAQNPVIPDLQTDAINQVIHQSREVAASEIVLALPWGDRTHIEFVREQLRVLPLPVRLLPDQQVRSMWLGLNANAAGHILFDLQRAPLNRGELAIKRLFDVVVASTMLILLFPLLLATGLAIKLDSSGPLIFRQRRRGFNGRDFVIHKFRTMRVLEDGDVIRQASKSDARVTRLGRLLRRSSIDELPQLINVLKGDMSIVGPRPHALAHDREYGALIGNYAFRHHVKPGITGWAQVSGFRGETSHIDLMQKRVELDIWYINHWSVLLDLEILARTVFEVGRATKAY